MKVLRIDSFKEIKKELYMKKINSFERNKNIEKLKFSYWENIIKE